MGNGNVDIVELLVKAGAVTDASASTQSNPTQICVWFPSLLLGFIGLL
jgi:hypothetical protein